MYHFTVSPNSPDFFSAFSLTLFSYCTSFFLLCMRRRDMRTRLTTIKIMPIMNAYMDKRKKTPSIGENFQAGPGNNIRYSILSKKTGSGKARFMGKWGEI